MLDDLQVFFLRVRYIHTLLLGSIDNHGFKAIQSRNMRWHPKRGVYVSYILEQDILAFPTPYYGILNICNALIVTGTFHTKRLCACIDTSRRYILILTLNSLNDPIHGNTQLRQFCLVQVDADLLVRKPRNLHLL